VALFQWWNCELKELTEHRSAGTVHGGTRGALDGFQIEAAGFAQGGEDHREKLIYFADGLLLDRFFCFFSCEVSVSSTGRAPQIFSLTSTKDRSNSR
jgi:hypothetical protein